ncbi:hypothetical protein HQ535_08980 [bacterium]|nr:hypothetical protein [bacterium]
MTALSRRKGRAFEQEAARDFRAAMPGADVFRGSQAWVKSKAADLRMPWFAPECKVGQRPNIYRAMAQAEGKVSGDRWPVVVSRKNGTCGSNPPVDLVTMRKADFLQMVRQWWGCFGEGEWVE